MGLSCGGNFFKFLTLFFNGIVFLGGGVITGYGIYLLVEAGQTGGNVSVVLPAVITALGLLLFLVGFLGCFGACYNNTCMLITFAVVVGLLLVGEIVCGILILVYRHDFVEILGDKLSKLISDFENGEILGSDPTLKGLLDMQKNLKCCGGRNKKDWQNVPKSCCKSAKCDTHYETGCAQALYDKAKDSGLAMGITILIIALIQIGAIICAACLVKKVRHYKGV